MNESKTKTKMNMNRKEGDRNEPLRSVSHEQIKAQGM